MTFKLRKRLIAAAIASAAVVPALIMGAGSAFAQSATPSTTASSTSTATSTGTATTTATATTTTTATATATATTTTTPGVTIDAKVGEGEPGYSVNAFLPQDLTVLTGTTVNWSFPWYEPHMIVLDNGLTSADLSGPEPPADTSPFDFDGVRRYVYSGTIFGDPSNPPTFAIKFEKAGTYNIECLIHPGMTGQVTVVDSGSADTQASADARAQSEYTTAITALKAAAAQAASAPTKITPQADGSNLYEVDMVDWTPGVGGTFNYIQQYFPATVNINAGDSVNWVTLTSNNVHTVTFNVENSGIDPATTDPFSLPETAPAGNVYDGSGEYINSGILGGFSGDGPDDPASVANPTAFKLKFTKAGTYAYICMLHVQQGMIGTVNVAAQTASSPTPSSTRPNGNAPLPPNTGNGVATSNGSNTLWLGLGVLAALFAISGAGVVALKRHN